MSEINKKSNEKASTCKEKNKISTFREDREKIKDKIAKDTFGILPVAENTNNINLKSK